METHFFYVIEVYEQASGRFLGYHKPGLLAKRWQDGKVYRSVANVNRAIAYHYPAHSIYGAAFKIEVVKYEAVRVEVEE